MSHRFLTAFLTGLLFAAVSPWPAKKPRPQASTQCPVGQKHVAGKVVDSEWIGEQYAIEIESRFGSGVYRCGSPNDVLFRACQEIERGDRVEMCVKKESHPVRGNVAAIGFRRRG